MTIKHKVLKDFQLLTDDKKILILKAKTIIEDYKFKNKSETVTVPLDIIKNNPDYFAFIDWKEDLQSYLKTNKIPQPAVITKKLVPFIETMMSEASNPNIKEIIIEKEVIKEVIVEKPKIVEKEVVVEKKVSDDSMSIELELQLKKLKLKEEQLDKEIEQTNTKELVAEKKEKEATKLETELNSRKMEIDTKEAELTEKERLLNEKESILLEKESNLSNYVTKGQIYGKIDDYQRQGYSMTLFKGLVDEI
jgi:hypothetical protein